MPASRQQRCVSTAPGRGLTLPRCPQDLPCPVPVRTRLAPQLFGEALMVLEFLQAFGQVFDLKDEFPDGVSLGENALPSEPRLSGGWLRGLASCRCLLALTWHLL